jgi:hypothetical protein
VILDVLTTCRRPEGQPLGGRGLRPLARLNAPPGAAGIPVVTRNWRLHEYLAYWLAHEVDEKRRALTQLDDRSA